jgi:hypothetical protein
MKTSFNYSLAEDATAEQVAVSQALFFAALPAKNIPA